MCEANGRRSVTWRGHPVALHSEGHRLWHLKRSKTVTTNTKTKKIRKLLAPKVKSKIGLKRMREAVKAVMRANESAAA